MTQTKLREQSVVIKNPFAKRDDRRKREIEALKREIEELQPLLQNAQPDCFIETRFTNEKVAL